MVVALYSLVGFARYLKNFLYVLLPHELPQLNFLYQQKVEQSAEKKGVPPQDFVDEVSVNFRELLDLLNISNDQFIRTTDSNHKEAVQVRSTVYTNQLCVFLIPWVTNIVSSSFSCGLGIGLDSLPVFQWNSTSGKY